MPSNTCAEKCPLCDLQANAVRTVAGTNVIEVSCKRCGRVRVTASVVYDASSEGKLHLLSAFFRRLPASTDPPTANQENWKTLVKDVPDYSPLEKVDRLLAEVANQTTRFGDSSGFDPTRDYPLLAATNPGEALYLLRELSAEGLLSKSATPVALTLKGWRRLQEAQKTGRESNRAFVAMWFAPEMDAIYQSGIGPAIEAAGYMPLRVDRKEHVNRIDDEIVAGLRASRFLVADFTGHRGGVYFEAGFMKGLGRNVFWTCRKDALADLHFDINHFNFILYGAPDELRDRLRYRILSVEGQGPGTTPQPQFR